MNLESLQDWIVQTGLMVSLLILVILLIRRPFARAFGPNATYALWSLPLIRLCLPVFVIPQSWVPDAFKTADNFSGRVLQADDLMPPVSGSLDYLTVQSLPADTAAGFGDWSTTLIAIWLLFAVIWLAYQIFQQAKFKAELMSQSQVPAESIRADIKKAAVKVGLTRSPHVRISNQNIGPLVTGVLNPLVILPCDFEGNFETHQRHFALVHEFSHIKRADLWAALMTLVFRAINWPNPLVHFAATKLRQDQEAACDAYVVKITGGETAHSYAQTLVKAASQSGRKGTVNAHLALSLTQADTEISKGD